MATITMEKQPRRETSGCCVSAAYQSYIKRSQIETPCDLDSETAWKNCAILLVVCFIGVHEAVADTILCVKA